jgi:predicted DNA-binding transcriptional regulator YafY
MLRWWILSQGAKIEVLKPKRLCREIAEEAHALAKLYKNDA